MGCLAFSAFGFQDLSLFEAVIAAEPIGSNPKASQIKMRWLVSTAFDSYGTVATA